MLIGIDPGMNTGIAHFEAGKLVRLMTIEPHQIERHLDQWKPAGVVFEDSRLLSHTWTTVKSRAAALKMARNVGEVDAYCRLIFTFCAERRIPVLSISPKGKGAKMDHDSFCELTGWFGQTNEHKRDAAMVAWPYRRGFRHA